MIIRTLIVENFRCFGPEPTVVDLEPLTTLLGANGSGKSAVLMALARMFGVSSSDRNLERGDFHLPPGADADKRDEASLRLEAVIEFPELTGAAGDTGGPAACFKHMTVDGEGGVPYCRVRLTGRWEKSNLPDGEVVQKLEWVTCPLGTIEANETTLQVSSQERSRIHVHYVPASRDPARQVRLVSGSLLHRLLRAVQWSDETRCSIEEASESIRTAFEGEAGVGVIEKALRLAWDQLHAAPEHRQVSIRPVSRALGDIIRQVEATFRPGPSDPEDGLDRLSDGQRSLFYLSIVSALFDVQAKVAAGDGEDSGIAAGALVAPSLSVLAIEEPENHVAPHFLGRIMRMLRAMAEGGTGQVVTTSHSPSIVARVEPGEIRHLRKTRPAGTAIVRSVRLPAETDEAHKFVREAVRSYPELYFSKVVVLGEGSSEGVVLPRIAQALNVPFDVSFVSVVPLGGRHVRHFWSLLTDLGIPHVTLLDLDRERPGGGWGRIKYALKELLGVGVSKVKLLSMDGEDGPELLSDEELDGMHSWDDTETECMGSWIHSLEGHGVFFSSPLDLDFLMQRAFPNTYEQSAPDTLGPRIPDGSVDYLKAAKSAVRSVLKGAKAEPTTYGEEEVWSFFWYRYLFLGRSKPSTHLAAMTRLNAAELASAVPPVLARLVERVAELLTERSASEDDADY